MRYAAYACLLSLAALLLSSRPGRAQGPGDHLVPPAGTFVARGNASEVLLRRQLRLDSVQAPLAMVVVQPAFEPAYGLWVEHLAGDQYRLTYRAVAAASGQTQASRPLSSTCLLDPALAQALADLFAVALAQTRYDTFQGLRGDGTTFTFIAFQAGSGLRSGEVWAPAPATNMGLLVEIAAGLREAATTPSQPRFRQGWLLAQARSLLLRLASR